MQVATWDLPRGTAHPFYARLHQTLDQHDLDGFVEGLCERFYADDGRPGLPPGRYFRLRYRTSKAWTPSAGWHGVSGFVCVAGFSRAGVAGGAA
jgi:hypothetical protein